MSFLPNLISVFFILSPIIGFLPQIRKDFIIYKPSLSLLNIFISTIKIFDYTYQKYSSVILMQNIFLILLHLYLIKNNRNIKRDKNNMQMAHLPDAFVKLTVLIVTLNFLSLIQMKFIFNPIALILEVMTTYIQYLIYKNDPNRPWELLMFWVIGDLLKLYFNLIIYKSPYFYSLSILIQLIFDVLTVTTASQSTVPLEYMNM